MPSEFHDDFIGREFVLWLWYRFETEGGMYDLDEIGRVGVAFDVMLVLEGSDGGSRTTLKGDLPTRLPEADAALRSGRFPTRSRLILATGSHSVEVTLDTVTFDLLSVKLVADDAEAAGTSDPRERADEQAQLLLDVPNLIDRLFHRFLLQRLDAQFDTELAPKIREWIATRGRSKEEALAMAGGA